MRATRTIYLTPYELYGRENQVKVAELEEALQASGSHLDLGCVPYVLYGVEYIDLVSLVSAHASGSHHDLSCVPYVLYGVEYIVLVSLAEGVDAVHHTPVIRRRC